MTPRMIDLVQESFRKIAPRDELAASIFYARLFQTAPHLRRHFPEDMVGQRRKLMAALGFIVTALKNPDRLVAALQALGERHVSYGPACTHYDVVRDALLFALRERMGDDWTEELHQAWSRALITTAAVMRDAGERALLARQAAEAARTARGPAQEGPRGANAQEHSPCNGAHQEFGQELRQAFREAPRQAPDQPLEAPGAAMRERPAWTEAPASRAS